MSLPYPYLPCLVALCGLIAAAGGATDSAAALPTKAKAKIDFDRQVQPILAKRCFECHGPEEQEGGLRLDVKSKAFEGGDFGPAIVPGDSDDSELIARVDPDDEADRMPPEGDPLTAAQIKLLRAWIDQGTDWSEHAEATDLTPKTDHWAFQPPPRPPVPSVKNQAWVRNSIDAFVLANLEALGIRPSLEAGRGTLIRRLSLDLLGLPPSPEDVAGFVYDNRPDAYERLVDRLLASPHFGERWARHWLDLARYADSDGYEKDRPRPHAWRYRDWVINAINRDMPYDQFTIEQLAGDLLPDATREQNIATGFHRNTLTNREGGVDQEEYRVKAVIDRVNTTGSVWLAQTIGCCECHSHKYDPFTQREYYGLFAFFNDADEKDIDLPPPADQMATYRKAKTAHDAKVKTLTELLKTRKAESAPDEEVAELTKQLSDLKKKAPQPPQPKAMAMAQRDTPRETHVHIRGDFQRLGDPVQPHTLAVLSPLTARGARPDRLDLARWLGDPANPLTARVAVNRMWQYLFGRGLVETAEDFGSQGTPPTHPALLDWLATEFTARGWSRKQMLKLLVMSAAYRQSSAMRPELDEHDPKNELLARQRRFRVDAEIVRDLCLAASGLFHPAVGGPSVRPPLPDGVAMLGYANQVRWAESKGQDRYRRGMYIHFQRTVPYPSLITFDCPDSNVTISRRTRSNTPLQALITLNDPVFLECAQALGRRILAEGPTDNAGRLRFAGRLCLSRNLTPGEQQRLQQLLASQTKSFGDDAEAAAKLIGSYRAEQVSLSENAAWVTVARVFLNLDEFLTRE